MEENIDVDRTRRRRHTAEFKAQAGCVCMQPGISIAAVALHYRLNANLLRRWIVEHEGFEVAAQAREALGTPSCEFVPLHLPAPAAPPVVQDIVIEVRRGAAQVTVRWPSSAASHCATWPQGWLR